MIADILDTRRRIPRSSISTEQEYELGTMDPDIVSTYTKLRRQGVKRKAALKAALATVKEDQEMDEGFWSRVKTRAALIRQAKEKPISAHQEYLRKKDQKWVRGYKRWKDWRDRVGLGERPDRKKYRDYMVGQMPSPKKHGVGSWEASQRLKKAEGERIGKKSAYIKAFGKELKRSLKPSFMKKYAVQRSTGVSRVKALRRALGLKEEYETMIAQMLNEGLTPEQCIDAMINVPVRRFRGVDRRRLAGFDEAEVLSIATHPEYRREARLKLGPGYISGAKIPLTQTKRTLERANLPLKMKKELLAKTLKREIALGKLEKLAKRVEGIRKKSGAAPFDPEKSAEWQRKMGKRYQSVTWRRKRSEKPPKFKGFAKTLPEEYVYEQTPMATMPGKGMTEPDAAKAVDTELLRRKAERDKARKQQETERKKEIAQQRAEQDKAKRKAAADNKAQADQARKQAMQQQDKEREQRAAEAKKASEKQQKEQQAALQKTMKIKEAVRMPKRRLLPTYFYKYPAGNDPGENITLPGKAGPGV